MRIIDLLNKFFLFRKKYYSLFNEFLFLLGFYLNKSNSWILLNKNFFLKNIILEKVICSFVRRLRGEPLQYIINKCYFYGLNFKIYYDIFIPRIETEVMVEYLINLINLNNYKYILELGSGSGAISLVLAYNCINSKILGVDINNVSLKLSIYNSKKLNLKNVSFIKSDWFSNINNFNSFDLIVSNPPYINKNSFFLLNGDLRFESYLSLVSNLKGIGDIHYIIKNSIFYLKKNGWLVLEHASFHKNIVIRLLNRYSYININSYKDYKNLYRFTVGQKKL